MVSLLQFSVFVVTFGLHISSVLSVYCYDLPPYDYTCYSGSCCYGFCCLDGYYCCGTATCCVLQNPTPPSYPDIPQYTPTYTLPTSAIIGIVVGSVVIGLLLISGIIALCCMCCRGPRNGQVLSGPPQYAQEPYVVNSQYDQMVQQPYPTQIQHPVIPQPQRQPTAHIPPTDYEQNRRPERPRQHHSIPRAQY